MKIEKHKQEGLFQPIKITISIETLEEYEALQQMAYFNDSIPELLNEHGSSVKRVDIIRNFLDDLSDVL
jgi:hypothetical protein